MEQMQEQQMMQSMGDKVIPEVVKNELQNQQQ